MFGVPVYTTDDSTQVKDSPTRKIQRKYRNRAGEEEVVEEPGMEEEEQFGTPTFYSHEESLAETVHQSPAEGENRPILTILREILNSNKSLEMSVKDVANVTKGGTSHYDIARHFNKQRTFEEVTTMSHIKNVNIYKHSPPPMIPHGAQSTLKPFTLHKPLTTSLSPGEASDHSEDGEDYQDKFKQIWPYRTDDKYSLFYFHPSRGDKERAETAEGAEYPWPSLSDQDEVYHHDYRDYEARQADSHSDNLNREQEQSTLRWRLYE